MDPLLATIARSCLASFATLASSRLSILIFHRVHARADSIFPREPDAARFERLMRFVARSFRVITLGEAVRGLVAAFFQPSARLRSARDARPDPLVA